MCILASTIEDGNSPKLHYVEFTNLPIDTTLGNANKGGGTKIIGHIISDLGDYRHTWVDLNNPAPMTITDIQVKIINKK